MFAPESSTLDHNICNPNKRWLLAGIVALLGLAAGCSGKESAPPFAAATGGSSNASGGRPPGSGGLAATGSASSVGFSGGASSLGGSQSSGGSVQVASGGGPSAMGAGGAEVIPESGSKNWVYIMLGQSNMEGQAPLEASDQQGAPRVFKLNHSKEWVPAVEPVALWGNSALSPSRAFGLKILEKVTDPEVNIFVINAAVGGTAIVQWNPQNGEHYLGMLPYLEAGMQMGTVRGFIWHQGESDTDTSTADYAMKFTELVQGIRTKVGDPLLPVVAGQVGTGGDDGAVNNALALVATTDSLMRVSSSAGLSLIPGDVHYDAPSERLMGEKMATEWWSILGK